MISIWSKYKINLKKSIVIKLKYGTPGRSKGLPRGLLWKFYEILFFELQYYHKNSGSLQVAAFLSLKGHRQNLAVQFGGKNRILGRQMDLEVYTNSIKIYLQAICICLNLSASWGKTEPRCEKKKRLTGPSDQRLTPILRPWTSCVGTSGLPQTEFVRETASHAPGPKT